MGVKVEVGKTRLFLSWGFQSLSLNTRGSDRLQEGGSATNTLATQPQAGLPTPEKGLGGDWS